MQPVCRWIVGLLLMVIMSACTPADPPPPPQTWDLQDGHEITRIGWDTAEDDDDIFHQEGGVVTLKLPDRIVLDNWEVSNLYAVRLLSAPTLVDHIVIRAPAMTTDEAHAEATRLAAILELPQERIDTWAAKNPSKTDHFIAVGELAQVPTYALRSTPSYDDEKPWVLSLEIAWGSASAVQE